jgi:glutathione reductase (NADPH)
MTSFVMPVKFDLICLGTGPAASTVATICAKQGWNVAIVESRDFGGTCALRGCNPKKVFTNAAALIDQFQRARGRLTRGNDVRIEWSDLVTFQHEFTDPIRELTEGKLRKLGITTIHGIAQFESERVIRAGETLLEAPNIFLGVGARPVPLNIPGEDLVITSDDFMELGSLPAQLLFLGGGFISFEFANLARRIGSTVTIVDRHELPLKSFDPDLVRLLVTCSEAADIEIMTETEATSIEKRNGRINVTLKTAEGDKIVSTDLVVNGGGRVPNLDGMNLEAGRIAHGKRGVTVNEFLQSTTNPAVYAAGDCADTGVQMLTPTANESARMAAANLLADRQSTAIKGAHTNAVDRLKQKADYGPVPQVVFSVPPLASVGLTEAEARQRGFDLDVRFQDLSTKGEVRKICASAAACKIIIDRQTNQILGAHVLGPHAEEVINLFTLAIRFNLTTANLKSTLFTYPTMTAEFCRML